VDKINAGIFIFDGVEVLDFAGPFEVFSRTRLVPGLESRRSEESAPFHVFTVAKTHGPLVAIGGLTVTPRFSFEDTPPIHLLVVPGGFGVRGLLEDPATLEWIRRTASAARRTSSVCSGALLLARAGLLSGRRATTHWSSFDRLAELAPDAKLERDSRFVDDGVWTSAGVAAGIDLAFHIVETLCGRDVADDTARYIEYPR